MEHLGRGLVARGLMGSQVIVEPEVVSQLPSGLDGVDVGFERFSGVLSSLVVRIFCIDELIGIGPLP